MEKQNGKLGNRYSFISSSDVFFTIYMQARPSNISLLNNSKFRMQRRLPWMLEEIGFLVALALPTSIECFTEGLQMKLSNILIGRTSGNNVALMLSALFIGQTMNSQIAYPIAEGFGMYVNVLCSQAYGAKQRKQVAKYYYRAMLMVVIACFPILSIFLSVRPIMYHVLHEQELARYTGKFTFILCFGLPAYFYYKIGIRFLQALSIVWCPVFYLIIGNILNGLIQYILIFHYNIGIEGAAIGYVISNYLLALLVFAHIQLSDVHNVIRHNWSIEIISDWYQTAKYAIFPMLQMFMDGISVTVFPIIFIGLIAGDQRELAIFSALYSAYWVVCMGSMGFSSAIAVRVSLLLGSKEPKQAKRSAILGIVLGIIVLLPSSLLFLTASKPLSYLFTTETSFAKELEFDFRISSILIFNNVNYIGQGLMNACCKQGTQIALKIILKVILGSILIAILVHYVSWKALGILLQYFITGFASFAIILLILFLSDWNKIAEKVEKNTNTDTVHNQSSGKTSKVFELFRYLMCLFVGICILITVAFLEIFTGN